MGKQTSQMVTLSKLNKEIDELRKKAPKMYDALSGSTKGLTPAQMGAKDLLKKGKSVDYKLWEDELASLIKRRDEVQKQLSGSTADVGQSVENWWGDVKNKLGEDLKSIVGELGGAGDEIAKVADTANEFNLDDLMKSLKGSLEGSTKEAKDGLGAFVNAVKSQAQQFRDALGLFDKAVTEKLSPTTLMARLKGQLNVLAGWKKSLDDLRSRLGGDSALFQDLLQRGPQAAGEIAALSRLTNAQLSKYQAMYGDKSMLTSGLASEASMGARRQEQRTEQVIINIDKAYGDGVEDLANKIIQKLRTAGVY
jgi:hypothetical protein